MYSIVHIDKSETIYILLKEWLVTWWVTSGTKTTHKHLISGNEVLPDTVTSFTTDPIRKAAQIIHYSNA